ncbi:orexin receptor type 2-like [Diadema antillarum]|uniref:orexin receptor type 2-like n=1 Tax=Diadema antillarum TaxID=105358 RepID=UPI003A883401
MSEFATIAAIADNGTRNGTDLQSSEVPLVWNVLEGIIGTLGILGNGVVLFVFFRDKSLRGLINSFIINQSLIDFTTSFVFILMHFLPKKELNPASVSDELLCKIWLSEYVMWALFISSSLNLVCITTDRYFAIIHPTRYRSSASKLQRRIKVVSIITWSSGFIIDAYWPAVYIVTPTGMCFPNWQNKILKGAVGVFIFFVTYAGPLGTMAFSYVCILSKLRKQSHLSAPQPISSPVPANGGKPIQRAKRMMSERSGRAARNVIRTMVTVSLTYAICWAPIAFNYLVYNLGGPLDFQSKWYSITKVFAYANMCANPFIYTMQYQQFQKGFERAFKVKIFRGLPDSDPTKTLPSSSQEGKVDVVL